MKIHYLCMLVSCFWLLGAQGQELLSQKFDVIVRGKLDNQKGLKNYKNIVVGVLWHSDDFNPKSTHNNWNISTATSQVRKNGEFSFKITQKPPQSSCIVTPRFALAIGFIIAFVDQNNNQKFDKEEEIIGLSAQHTLSFVKGNYQKGLDAIEKEKNKRIRTLRQLKSGIFINQVVPKNQHGLPNTPFDDLRPVKNQKVKIKVVIPKNLKDLDVPNWT